MPLSTTMVGRAKVRASSSRQPRPLVRVRLHRSRDGSSLERLRLQLVQLLYEALQCDPCHRTPSVTCPCSSWCCRLSSFIIPLRARKKGGLFARPPFLSRSVGLETDRPCWPSDAGTHCVRTCRLLA